ALTGSYVQLASYATFMFWVLYGVTVAGLIALRRRQPAAPRPYRMFAYPITAVLFIGVAASVAIFAFVSAPLTSIIGLLILLTGVPADYLCPTFHHVIADRSSSRPAEARAAFLTRKASTQHPERRTKT